MLSADGGGALIPCSGDLPYTPDELTSEDSEMRRKHLDAWKKFQGSGEMKEFYEECKRKNP